MWDFTRKRCQENLEIIKNLLTFIANDGGVLDARERIDLLNRASTLVSRVQNEFIGVEDWAHMSSLTADDLMMKAEDTDFDFITEKDIVQYGDLSTLSGDVWNVLSRDWDEAFDDLLPDFWYWLMQKKMLHEGKIGISGNLYHSSLGHLLESIGVAWNSPDDLLTCSRLVNQVTCPEEIEPREVWHQLSSDPQLVGVKTHSHPTDSVPDDLIFEAWRILRYQEHLIWEIDHNVFENPIYREMTEEERSLYEIYVS